MSETRTVTKPILDALAQLGIFAMRLNSGTIQIGQALHQASAEGHSRYRGVSRTKPVRRLAGD